MLKNISAGLSFCTFRNRKNKDATINLENKLPNAVKRRRRCLSISFLPQFLVNIININVHIIFIHSYSF